LNDELNSFKNKFCFGSYQQALIEHAKDPEEKKRFLFKEMIRKYVRESLWFNSMKENSPEVYQKLIKLFYQGAVEMQDELIK
jgi:hypothetical protein